MKARSSPAPREHVDEILYWGLGQIVHGIPNVAPDGLHRETVTELRLQVPLDLNLASLPSFRANSRCIAHRHLRPLGSSV